MSLLTRRLELPRNLTGELRKARLLEWISIVYIITVVVLMYLVLGSSQAMKAAWLDNFISLVPPIAVLVGLHLRTRAPSLRFPYGYHRAVSIAFQVASVALCVVGLYLIIDSSMKLIEAKHPTIGTMVLFGEPIWLGWLMLPVLAYVGIPAALLGRAKFGPAYYLHNKPLVADAHMEKADWMTALAAALGILGIGLGFWWADSVAALVIGLDILKDGVRHLKDGVFDLMDRRPQTFDGKQPADLPDRVAERLRQLDWVKHVEVRMREAGQVFFGEAFIIPMDDHAPLERIAEASRCADEVDWRMHDLVIQLTTSFGEPHSMHQRLTAERAGTE